MPILRIPRSRNRSTISKRFHSSLDRLFFLFSALFFPRDFTEVIKLGFVLEKKWAFLSLTGSFRESQFPSWRARLAFIFLGDAASLIRPPAFLALGHACLCTLWTVPLPSTRNKRPSFFLVSVCLSSVAIRKSPFLLFCCYSLINLTANIYVSREECDWYTLGHTKLLLLLIFSERM